MDTMKAVRVDVCGAAEQMSVKEVPLPKPGAGEARVKLKACGINLIDTYPVSYTHLRAHETN